MAAYDIHSDISLQESKAKNNLIIVYYETRKNGHSIENAAVKQSKATGKNGAFAPVLKMFLEEGKKQDRNITFAKH